MSKPGTPTEFARDTIRQLAQRRLVPTPDNYAQLYGEISGEGEWGICREATRALRRAAVPFGRRAMSEVDRELAEGNWNQAVAALLEAVGAAARRPPGDEAGEADSGDARRGADLQDQVNGLTLLLQLLLDNVADLTENDRWLRAQLDRLRQLVRAPVDAGAFAEAQEHMRQVIHRQGALKQSLADAKQALKELLSTFVDRLAAMSAHTGDFEAKVAGYADRIARTDDIASLSKLVHDLASDTRGMHAGIVSAREDLDAAKQRADAYADRVRALESELERVTGLMREDQLTEVLNRRGLEEAFLAESARSERSGEPLSVAMLDLDNFKLLNDRLGHQAGDSALVHLVTVIREVVRPTDVIGRYGGEEFVILLPGSDVASAEAVIVRVQRALTRRFFMHNNERLLIAFSAGLAQTRPAERWDTVLDRTDRALYEAKRLGKNRVVRASMQADRAAA
jgi:diguanylate cyclase